MPWPCPHCGKGHPTEDAAKRCKCIDQKFPSGQTACPKCGKLYSSYADAQACKSGHN